MRMVGLAIVVAGLLMIVTVGWLAVTMLGLVITVMQELPAPMPFTDTLIDNRNEARITDAETTNTLPQKSY